MTSQELRRRVAESARLISEAAFKQVEGMSDILQTMLAENKDLHDLLCKEQAESARLGMTLLNQSIEIGQLDDTICDLITPRTR